MRQGRNICLGQCRSGFLNEQNFVITIGKPDWKQRSPLLQALHELGYVEGQTMALEWRFSGGRYDPIPELAADLVRLKVDVIVTYGTVVTQAAMHATTTIPIVMANSVFPVETGLVASLARPGGNVTGVAGFGPEQGGKALEFLKEAVPGLSRPVSSGIRRIQQR